MSVPRGGEPDWDRLQATAIEAMRHAYAPYSSFPVGAAALVDDGRVVSGCNVENASYGLGLCAECGLVSELHRTGGGRLLAFSCVDARGAALMPCGRCRQLLWEHGGPTLLVATAGEPLALAELLPAAFGPADLDKLHNPDNPDNPDDPADRGLAPRSSREGDPARKSRTVDETSGVKYH